MTTDSSPLSGLVRPHLLSLQPYSSARDEFSGQADVWLDANENPYPRPEHRYPDPWKRELAAELCDLYGVTPDSLFIGHGSDEPIDLLVRAFCRPGIDRVGILPPTYGMYQVAASIHDAAVARFPLDPETFQPDLAALEPAFGDPRLKLLFLCSPNNPTGTLLRGDLVEQVLERFGGIAVLDEAYIEYAGDEGWIPQLSRFPKLVVLRTLSKAWGAAGLRVGMALGHPDVIGLLNRIRAPYNLSTPTQAAALERVRDRASTAEQVAQTLGQRAMLAERLAELPFVERVFPSDANFLLVRMERPREVFAHLLARGVVVRDRSGEVPGCLRLTVGTPEENERLLSELRGFPADSSTPPSQSPSL